MIGLAADDYRGRYEARQYADADGAKLLYRLLKPKDYDPQTKYPLVLFLHGAGERGDDNIRQLVHGMNDFASDEIMAKYPCFVVAPQCPKEQKWVDVNWSAPSHESPAQAAGPLRLSMEAIAALEKEFCDRSRADLRDRSVDGRIRDLGCDRPLSRPLRRRRADLRRRGSGASQDDCSHADLGLSRRQGRRGQTAAVARHDRSDQGGRRDAQVHRIPGRRPRFVDGHLQRPGIFRLAVCPTAGKRVRLCGQVGVQAFDEVSEPAASARLDAESAGLQISSMLPRTDANAYPKRFALER